MLGAIQVTARYPLAIGTLTLVSRNDHHQSSSSKEWADSSASATYRSFFSSETGSNAPSTVNSRSKFDSGPRGWNGDADDEEYRLPPPPDEWRQRPLFVRPTPGSKTRILRIRRLGKNSSIPDEDGSIPINNGFEAPGQSALVDFESDHFVGTLLILLRGAPSPSMTTPSSANHTAGRDFFGERTETWHGVVKGRFKQPHELSTCVTGQVFRRPAGRLLPHWLMQRLVMPLINRLAPYNAMDIECQLPYYWAPLAHMSQTVVVSNGSSTGTPSLPSAEDMERELNRTEPHGTNPQSIIHEIAMTRIKEESSLEGGGNLIKRLTKRFSNKFHPTLPPPNATNPNHANRKARKNFLKQYFDQVNNDSTQKFKRVFWSPDKEYTFGIYNHWVIFNDPKRGNEMALDLRLPFCHYIPLPTCTGGQPIVFMSALLPEEQQQGHRAAAEKDPTKLQYLWSFEIWHESLYPAAKKYHDNQLLQIS